MFASFTRKKFYVHPEIDSDDGSETLSSSRSNNSCTISPADHTSPEVSDDTSRPDRPDYGENTKDDMAVSSRPSRQVDYLFHNWREEDIWSSWRYVVMRRGDLPNSVRLENAIWRTWIKAKNNLKTISLETLDWLKDCDITWLYGPLHSVPNVLNSAQRELSKVSLPITDSHVNLDKKSILKKRSMPEEMLQRSLSTALLLKEATADVKVEKTRDILGPHMSRSSTDYPYKPFSQRRLGGESSSANTSTDPSGTTSLNCERKHTRFNERVEQCIAVEVKGVDYDNDELDTGRYGDDSDPDDGVMVKRTKTRKPLLFQRKNSESKPASMIYC
ncbi:related to negative regulator of glucose-repressible genes [Fusarium oxysporum]|uniref:Related to negative regulator of glucose-repressible genes n=1 Tax=Fusarium oxysporum TaxID=5507 RepID=A0A2H3TJU6_FUSOX|nr:related to negative regulator of glucose-repressible genes [Fusarium oxysporum]